MFLLQGIIVLDFFGHAEMDLHEAVFHHTIGAIADLPGNGDTKWGFGVGSMDIRETASAIQKGNSGSYGRRYVNENQVKKNLFPGYMVKYYAGNPSELLQIPVSVGKGWIEQNSGYTFRSIIAGTSETIDTPAGKFADCVKVKTLITGKRINSDGEENPEIDVFVRGTRFMWFAPSVGLVKVKYNHEEGSATEISLIGYSIKEAGKGYFPLALVLFLLVLPILPRNPFYEDVILMIFFWGTLASAWNLVGGFAGQISLGHTAFFGIGAYTSTLLWLRLGLSPWLGMFAGAGLAVVVAIGIGYACFRLRSHFFALATIAFAEVLRGQGISCSAAKSLMRISPLA